MCTYDVICVERERERVELFVGWLLSELADQLAGCHVCPNGYLLARCIGRQIGLLNHFFLLFFVCLFFFCILATLSIFQLCTMTTVVTAAKSAAFEIKPQLRLYNDYDKISKRKAKYYINKTTTTTTRTIGCAYNIHSITYNIIIQAFKHASSSSAPLSSPAFH